MRSSSGSYDPVSHAAAPPCIQASGSQYVSGSGGHASHVSCPGSPGPGMVWKRHTSSPVAASSAAMKPRTPRSPPAEPMITMSLTTSGARVNEYARWRSASSTFQSSVPVAASSATTCASSVAMNTRSPRIATPRLFDPQHARWSGGVGYR